MTTKKENTPRGAVQSRRIPESRVTKVKRQTNNVAIRLEKAEKALSDVEAKLAEFKEQNTFSAAKIGLELNKKRLEAEIVNLRAEFTSYQNTYFGYLEKNSGKLS